MGFPLSSQKGGGGGGRTKYTWNRVVGERGGFGGAGKQRATGETGKVVISNLIKPLGLSTGQTEIERDKKMH